MTDKLAYQIEREKRKERGRKIAGAVIEGWQHAKAGGLKSHCPYSSGPDIGQRTAWLAGFEDGLKGYALSEGL